MEFTCKSYQDRTYRIYFEWNILDRLATILEQEGLNGSIFVVSDDNVFQQHGKRLKEALKNRSVAYLIVRPGEPSKSLANWTRIQNFLIEHGADRKSIVIAFGGGVVGDLTGFAASTYMRGLDFIQIPTTVLSQSDSSIGAKVAVNHPQAKNLIGSFYQPRLVITDPSLLATLPPREFSAGLGEAIKYGVISDPDLFQMLDDQIEQVLSYNQEFLGRLISRCIEIKIQVVEQDERETGLRKILNFGHTVGHALEQATHFKRIRHGEAVAWGMLAEGWMAIHRKMWKPSEFERLKSIIFRAGSLYPFGKITPKDVLRAMQHDKKKVGKNLQFILPERTGKVSIVKDISHHEALSGIHFMFQLRKLHREKVRPKKIWSKQSDRSMEQPLKT